MHNDHEQQYGEERLMRTIARAAPGRTAREVRDSVWALWSRVHASPRITAWRPACAGYRRRASDPSTSARTAPRPAPRSPNELARERGGPDA